MSGLQPSEQLFIGYVVANAALVLGFIGWFIVRLDRIVAKNGSLDLYLNLAFRALPWQAGLLAAYFAASFLIRLA